MTQKQRKIRYIVSAIGSITLCLLMAWIFFFAYEDTQSLGKEYIVVLLVYGFALMLTPSAVMSYLSMALLRATEKGIIVVDKTQRSRNISTTYQVHWILSHYGGWVILALLIVFYPMDKSLLLTVISAIALMIIAYLFYSSWSVRSEMSEATLYIESREGHRIWWRVVLIRGVHLIMMLALGVYFWHIFMSLQDSLRAFIPVAIMVLLYGCVGAPIITWVLVTKVFKKWFVVADAESFSQWLADKQLGDKEK
jgi:hypothetical protein